MKKLLGILLIVLLAGCKNVIISENEEKAVDSVLKIYGGHCNSSKSFTKSTSGNSSHFTLEMSDSKVLEGLKQISELPASNIAYIFYTNLGGEKSKYTDIKVKIKFSGEQTSEFSYPVADIIKADRHKPVLMSVSDKIKAKDYNGLYTLFDTAAIPALTVDKLQGFCYQNDSAFGAIESTQFVGFSFFKSDDGADMVTLGGVSKRGKGNMPLNIIVDRNSKKVMSLKFEF